jgi:hypothetical protein
MTLAHTSAGLLSCPCYFWRAIRWAARRQTSLLGLRPARAWPAMATGSPDKAARTQTYRSVTHRRLPGARCHARCLTTPVAALAQELPLPSLPQSPTSVCCGPRCCRLASGPSPWRKTACSGPRYHSRSIEPAIVVQQVLHGSYADQMLRWWRGWVLDSNSLELDQTVIRSPTYTRRISPCTSDRDS